MNGKYTFVSDQKTTEKFLKQRMSNESLEWELYSGFTEVKKFVKNVWVTKLTVLCQWLEEQRLGGIVRWQKWLGATNDR